VILRSYGIEPAVWCSVVGTRAVNFGVHSCEDGESVVGTGWKVLLSGKGLVCDLEESWN